MLSRIYYWFKGVDENRPGGPWWYHDFTTEEAYEIRIRESFVSSLKPHCHKMMRLDREILSNMPIHFPEKDKFGPPDIYPPSDAVEL